MLIGAGGALVLAGGGAIGWRSAVGSMGDFDARAARLRAPIHVDAGIADIVRYAILAPNGHNTQPWQFHAEGNAIDIRPDFSRATPVVDPDDHHLYVGLGCAAENLLIAATATGRPGQLDTDAGGAGIRYSFSSQMNNMRNAFKCTFINFTVFNIPFKNSITMHNWFQRAA
jgi:hypothetical protein